jgi:hypothetical protein
MKSLPGNGNSTPISLSIDPFIELCQSRITFTATGPAGRFQRQFANIAFAYPFAQHTAQGIRIHIKMINQIG